MLSLFQAFKAKAVFRFPKVLFHLDPKVSLFPYVNAALFLFSPSQEKCPHSNRMVSATRSFTPSPLSNPSSKLMLQALNPRTRSFLIRSLLHPHPLADARFEERGHFRSRVLFAAGEVLFHLVAVGIHCSRAFVVSLNRSRRLELDVRRDGRGAGER